MGSGQSNDSRSPSKGQSRPYTPKAVVVMPRSQPSSPVDNVMGTDSITSLSPLATSVAMLNNVDWADVVAQAGKNTLPFKGKGKVANYIPALAAVDPNHFGAAFATVDGRTFSFGEADVPFSIQSISKVFSLALAYKAVGDELWKCVGREPSGHRFNSLVQLEPENGKPRNPFINAGAIVTTDVLQNSCGTKIGAAQLIVNLLRTQANNPRVAIDEAVAASEAATGSRNRAIAEFMRSFNNMRCSVDVALDQYFKQCAISASCLDLAKGSLFLARRTDPNPSDPLTYSMAKRVVAIMMTCGTYDGSGETAFRIGLPAKSGVGGGILAVLPGVGSCCVWSPGLDELGNSLAGMEFLHQLVSLSNYSLF